MTNTYFNHTSRFARHTAARAEANNDAFDGVEAGFDLLPPADDLARGGATFAVDTGSENAYVVAMPVTWTAYQDGAQCWVKISVTNTGASTLNVDGLGARSIRDVSGNDIAASDLTVGDLHAFIYDADNSRFRLATFTRSYLEAAQAAKTDAETARDSFYDLYIGKFAAPPIADNDGDPLTNGQLYFDTRSGVDGGLRIYDTADGWGMAVFDASDALLGANNLSDLADPAVARTNLGVTSSITSASTSGAAQAVAFNAADIHVATADASVLTLTFSSANAVDQITLLIKNDLDGYTLEDAVDMGQGAWPFSPSGIESIVVNPDGTRAFIMAFANDRIYQVDFATPFDHTTMTYSGVSMSPSDANPYGLAVSTDGLHLYYCGLSLDKVHQHTMSTAWDLSTVGSEVGFVSVSAQANNPYGLDISPDGTRLIVTFETAIYQYTLSTAFTVSTATYDSVSLNPAETGSTRNARFKPDGTKVFISDTSNTVFQYSLGTAWSLASPTYDSLSLDLPDSAFFIEGGGGYLFAPDNDGINRFLLDPLSLVYPSTLQKPVLATPHIGQSIALQIITTDSGASYQVVSAEEPIR